MKIGIIGAENSHTAAIATTLNVKKKVKGVSVDYVWGETDEFARAAAKSGQIPNIAKKQSDMMGKIDALMVDHRHAKYHLKAALPFVKAGIPTFVDKPFCYRVAEGREFLATARKCKTPVTSFSVLPMQRSTKRFLEKIKTLGEVRAATFYGPSDLKSKYGGIFFYGIHQIDLALEAFGLDVQKVLLTRNGDNATAQLLYRDHKIVTINLVKAGTHGFSCSVAGSEGNYHQEFKFDANDPYLTGIRTSCGMFESGVEPFSHQRILRPVEVLEALERSLKSGSAEKV